MIIVTHLILSVNQNQNIPMKSLPDWGSLPSEFFLANILLFFNIPLNNTIFQWKTLLSWCKLK